MKDLNNAPRQPVIRVEGLTKSFGSRRALRGIDLELMSGECVVLFGPNGAGKTTLINVLATIMGPTSGTVTVNGLKLKDSAGEVRRHIGVVSHHTWLYRDLTACENLAFYCRMYDVPAARERIEDLVEKVGMTSRLNDRVGTLSRGMQQRLSIARSLLHRPDVMLLDEPETGLDQQAMSCLWDVLRTGPDRKRSILFTTHDLERGFEIGERVLVMDRGRIVYRGDKEHLDLAGLKETYRASTGVVV